VTTADPIDVAVSVAAVFEALGVPYVLGGSLASTIHGEGRATYDVDFAADLGLDKAFDFSARLRHVFYVDEEMIREAAARGGHFNLVHLPTYTKVDVYVRRSVGFHASEFARARRMRLRTDPEGFARVASAEDTVIQKLYWFREGGEVSDRQWRDVLGVIKANGERLDMAYLREWARQRDLKRFLDRALRESGWSQPSD